MEQWNQSVERDSCNGSRIDLYIAIEKLGRKVSDLDEYFVAAIGDMTRTDRDRNISEGGVCASEPVVELPAMMRVS